MDRIFGTYHDGSSFPEREILMKIRIDWFLLSGDRPRWPAGRASPGGKGRNVPRRCRRSSAGSSSSGSPWAAACRTITPPPSGT